MIIFDTDVLIDAGREVSEALAALQEAESHEEVAVSAVTEMELIVGCRNKRELSALDQFLERFDVLPISEAVSERATALVREYRLSHGLLIPDALIATSVIARDVPLISKNQRDYHFMDVLTLMPYPEPFS